MKGSFCRAREDQTRKTTPAAAIRLVSNHSLDAVVGFAVAGGYVAEDSRGREGRRFGSKGAEIRIGVTNGNKMMKKKKKKKKKKKRVRHGSAQGCGRVDRR